MRKILSILLLLLIYHYGFTQRTKIVDSLRNELTKVIDDTGKVLVMSDLSFMLGFFQPDSGLVYAQNALDLAIKIHYFRGQARALNSMGFCANALGNLPKALNFQFQGLRIAEERHYNSESVMCLLEIGRNYADFDLLKGIDFIKKAKLLNGDDRQAQGYEFLRNRVDLNLGILYSLLGQLDSAFVYLESTYNRTLTSDFFHPPLLVFFGELQYKKGNQATGIGYLHQSIEINRKNRDHLTSANACRILAVIYSDINLPDSAIYYAKIGLTEAQIIDYKDEIFRTGSLLANLYESLDINKAYQYLKIANAANEEIRGPEKIKELQKQISEEQEHQRKIEAENIAYKNRIRTNAFLGSSFTLLIIASLLYWNNRQKHRSKRKIEVAYERLKNTQSQLIHSEKMASLGELTAGIAHEIQNPLNFVNNFSDVSNELVEEMKTERSKPKEERDDDLENEILMDVGQNLQKIKHHGQRASDIVKSMLHHSRTSSGEKILTDINALCDEYLRLAYHGMRAKDTSFNAKFETQFDSSLPRINVIPQDVGRVLLNLFNNAFYAVHEKAKAGSPGYEPTVIVSTRPVSPAGGGQEVEITVSDNGNGIPDSIKDKIFQPFFTTKPAGQGTGLGLSLSYDIVKAHGGELKVASKEGEGSVFIIRLPGISKHQI